MNLFFHTARSTGAWHGALLARAARRRTSQHRGRRASVPRGRLRARMEAAARAGRRSARCAKAIFNLGAGVDATARIPRTLPRDVPLIRLDDAGMAEQMAEYVVHAVLRRYREFDAYAQSAAQRAAGSRGARLARATSWSASWAWVCSGRAVAGAFAPFGFPDRTAGAARARQIAGVRASRASRARCVSRPARVLVCMLPLTPETRGCSIARRCRNCRGAPIVINVARGALVVDARSAGAARSRAISPARRSTSFSDEPLPPAHRFWHHPRITVTPHVSAVTLIEESVAQIAAKIRRLEAGLPVTGVVDRDRGY